MPHKSKYFLASMCLLSTAALVPSIFTHGNPWQIQKQQRDQTRVSDLSNISYGINSSFEKTGTLPDDQTQNSTMNNYKDPKTGQPYQYIRSSDYRYQLCAIFETSNYVTNIAPSTQSSALYKIQPVPESPNTQFHPKDRYCFVYNVTPPKRELNLRPFSGTWNFDDPLDTASYSSTTGKYENAAMFDGKQLYSLGPLQASPTGSIALWVKPSSTNQSAAFSGYGTFFGRQVNTVSSNLIFGFDSPKNGHAVFWLSHQPTNRPSVISKSPIPSGQWTHLTATWSGSNVKLYINGVLENQIYNAIPDTGPSTNSVLGISYEENQKINNFAQDGDVTVGGVKDGWSGYFNGAIDELKLYDYALSEQEIKNLSE